MAEPLKNMYHETFLREFGMKVQGAYRPFQTERFVSDVLDEGWEALELKGRIRQIASVLGKHLPDLYADAIDVLFQIDEQCVGFPYLFFPDFVEVYGAAEDDWELSMRALERFTARSSAEFAIRSFIVSDPARAMKQMLEWSLHPNEHVRRLASEGCRPRLPWGQSLPAFKREPAPVLEVLELLKADPSLYVRKSVANNLNDIAKDHPQLVLETAKSWIGIHPDTNWIVRHACRTLIRQADPAALALFGYAEEAEGAPLAVSAAIEMKPSALIIGDSCELQYELRVRDGDPARIRVEYGIDFVKAKGQTSRKLFLLSDKTVPGGSIVSGKRMHHFADLTTRKHYPGEHRVVLLVNGVEAAAASIMLNGSAMEQHS
ncbi:3-methyladenine DNA glycosylase AlkC [Paenibacillus cellulosilyticus]|uniref:3-methyladenine DNA glycosylase AlkC n=1 Tax=Paenibacillus cellulosilyticus TaxID=375489 RepID=A0A2V2YTM7_9BACL|nr:DNA alkylation repair protein [Paenibacillus cellulosilyticus]PWW02804.1 3-methyladenine DNA glycosylase AlkC [Paenibacillus cellulosilyticus]QKS45726.1 DNA alkylation repair protein [Paenibacillus cellulosilyticus]